MNLRPLALFVALVAVPAQAAPLQMEASRPDGSTIHWYLDRPDTDGKIGLVVLAQGSGCQSALKNQNIALVRQMFAGFAALTVDKYGVAPGDDPADPFGKGCGAEFNAHHTMTQRVEDYAQVLKSLGDAPWWNGQLVLFGGSEGGDIAARLSAEVEADAVVLLSTGGGVTFGEMVRQSILGEMARLSVPREQWPQVDAAFEKARKEPMNPELWSGSSYRFWADAIDNRPADSMLRSSAQLLLIQGGIDTSTPVSAARITLDMFAAAGRCNLTYWEFPAYDHLMTDSAGGSHMADVLSQAAVWVGTRLAADAAPSCGSLPATAAVE